MGFKVSISEELRRSYEKDKSRKRAGEADEMRLRGRQKRKARKLWQVLLHLLCSPADKIQGKAHETSHAAKMQKVTASSFISCTGKPKLTLSFPMTRGCHIC